DPEARVHDALASRNPARKFRPDTALPRQLALAVRNDDLEALLVRAQRLAERLDDAGNAIGTHAPDPWHADAPQRGLDVEALAAAVPLLLGGENILLTGGTGVAVVHDDQHLIVLVEHRASDTGDKTVMPETAVAHHADGADRLRARDGGGGGQRHAV